MDIEVLSVGADLYRSIEPAIRDLNAIQKEFVFRVAPERSRKDLEAFVRARYTKSELYEELAKYRGQRQGLDHVFIIAFVNKFLEGNIFGSRNQDARAAIATVHEYDRYVRDIKRFCSYYLLRYALSFCNFEVRSHNRAEDKDCYFHQKIYKKEIALSMKSGHLCDTCRRQLKLTPPQALAFQSIADLIAGKYPHALVMKGGGIKGLAYAGALSELANHFKFDIYVGTSAGAIAAVLLAAGYTPNELEEILGKTRFSGFLDRIWRWPVNLWRGGLHSGDAFRAWIVQQLRGRIPKQGTIELADIPGRAIIYACSPGRGTLVFDSRGKRKETDAGFAVRTSMSIPLFFVPQQLDGFSAYDGGLRHNFPVARFVSDNPNKPFLALYLQPKEKQRFFRILELYDVWTEGDELEMVDSYAEGVVLIDPEPIGTTEFRLTDDEKKLLIESGRLGAMRLMRRRNMDDSKSDSDIDELANRVAELRASVIRVRGLRLRRYLAALALAVLIGGYYWDWHVWAFQALKAF